jgi:hypothetical protein
MKPANTSASELVPTPTTNFIFPTQFPPPNVVVQQQLQQQKQGAYPSHTVVPRPMNFIACNTNLILIFVDGIHHNLYFIAQLPSTEDQRMALYENCFEDSDDDGGIMSPPSPVT